MNIMEDAPAAPVAMWHRLQERDAAAAQVAGTTTQTEMGLGWAGVKLLLVMKLDPGMHIGLHLVFFGKSGVTIWNVHTARRNFFLSQHTPRCK
jgi:hypothetical protein